MSVVTAALMTVLTLYLPPLVFFVCARKKKSQIHLTKL
jgi:hypothetical protein